jgi:hypothetical protein
VGLLLHFFFGSLHDVFHETMDGKTHAKAHPIHGRTK